MAQSKSLDSILNTASKAKILRLLVSREGGFRASGRQIASLIKISAPSTHAALKELHGQDIVKREIIGRQHIYGLNGDNPMVKEILIPMFLKEHSLRREIESHFTKRVRNANVHIIAGSNGSGKTTFARRFLPDYAECRNFVNSDLIAQGLSPFSPQGAALKAGRLVLEEIRDLSRRGLDFGFETTLAGKLYMKRLKELKNRGYSLHLYFLWIPTPELAIARIKDRVADGGHHVPSEDVKRRFFRGIYNLFRFYRPLLDSWMLLDNSSATPSLIAKERGKELAVINENLYEHILKMAR